MTDIRELLVPERQRKTFDSLNEAVNYGEGDVLSKRSGFVIMLALSSLIAAAGVINDSTATVIGAMIIAPLATPIHGVALGIVSTRRGLLGNSLVWLLGGACVPVLLGLALAFTVADPADLAKNSEVIGRTSPGLLDLVAAIATGLAGAWAMSRTDLSAVLPGVAIAISLVPPLAVAGVCVGVGEFSFALGATVLFASNVLALIAAGSLVYTLAGYRSSSSTVGRTRIRAYALLTMLTVVIAIPLALNSWIVQLSAAAQETTETWLEDSGGGEVTDIQWHGTGAVIWIQTPGGDIPDLSELGAELTQRGVPDFFDVQLNVTPGSEITVP